MTADDLALSPLKRALLAIERLQSRVGALEGAAREPIAIVGLGCRVPGGANDPEAFWRLLAAGEDAIGVVPADRWDADRYYDPDPDAVGKMSSKWGGFLNAVDRFDAEFFGITPREAARMDPQQRLLLEVAWEGLEDAALCGDGLAGSRTGVFVGLCTTDYGTIQDRDPALIDPFASVGVASSIAAGRVAYHLDLRGPCLTLDTACSSSLAAVHLACASLRRRECDLALAGGVNVILSPLGMIAASRMRMLAADGRCKTFDARADGMVRGEGCLFVVLKRLSDALADGHTIRALVRGSAMNQDGRTSALTAPNVHAQQAVIRTAPSDAGVAPAEVTYIEAHGSATSLGDPIEIEALAATVGAMAPDAPPCAVGAVKTNIGHLESAAGVAGLAKVVLALEHEAIPPNLHFRRPNPNIAFEGTRLAVPTSLESWPRSEVPRVAGVSAFGWSGTNAHVVLGEAPAREPSSPGRTLQVLCLSARTAAGLEATTDRLAAHFAAHPDTPLADVAWTLQRGRRAYRYRRALVCRTAAEAADLLAAREPGHVLDGTLLGVPARVAFLLSGVGDHYPGMAAELYRTEPEFRAGVDACCERLTPLLGTDLRSLLYPPDADRVTPSGHAASGLDLRAMLGRGERSAEPASPLTETRLAQPAVFVVSWALAQLWKAWGIQPSALLGHSIGEYVAATLAGVFSLDDALAIVAARAQMIADLPAGAMLAVPVSEEALQPWLGEQVWLSAVNAPGLCVVSGAPAAVDALAARLGSQGVACRRVPATHAFHSPMLAPIADRFAALVGSVPRRSPTVPFVSNLTGQWITAEAATDPGYWARHLCAPVRFADGIALLAQEDGTIMLEVGPGQALRAFALQHPAARQRMVLASLRHVFDRQPDLAVLLDAVARLWLGGVTPGAGFWAGQRRHRVSLPTYPFERRRHWLDPAHLDDPGSTPVPRAAAPARKQADIADWFYVPGWRHAPPARRVPGARGRTVAFVHCGRFGSALVEQLRIAGHDVVPVRPGECFRVDEHGITIRADARGDYDRVVALVWGAGQAPLTVVHAWDVEARVPAPDDEIELSRSQRLGFHSLVRLAQALADAEQFGTLRIDVVTERMQQVTGMDCVRPEAATILGACRVVPQEYPHLTCRTIDVSFRRADGAESTVNAELVASEVDAASADLAVAFRGRQRFVQEFQPLHLPAPEVAPFRRGGRYVIVGGLGRLGLHVAAHLARAFGARIALVGRDGLPPREEWDRPDAGDGQRVRRRISDLRRIAEDAGDLLVLVADVADEGAMRTALDAVCARWGGIDGMVHAAGVTGLAAIAPLAEFEPAVSDEQFRAKVRGLVVLDRALGDSPVDFCLVISSLGAVLGGLGHAVYAAANAFADAFAHRRALRRATPWISLGSDYWQNDRDDDLSPALGTSTAWDLALHTIPFARIDPVAGFMMTPAEGVAVIERALVLRTVPHIVNSTGQLERRMAQWVLRTWLTDAGRQGTAPERHDRPELPNAYVAPATEIERQIGALWEELLGVAPIGVHDNFLDLGGQSLVGMQIISRLRQELGVEIPLRLLFEEPTVGALAAAVVAMPRGGTEADEPLARGDADGPNVLEELSDDEVDRLLRAAVAGPEAR